MTAYSGNHIVNPAAALGGNGIANTAPACDTIKGGAGDDLLVGGRGCDVIIFGLGTDTVLGCGGDDTIYAVDNAWTGEIDGGSGTDTLNLGRITNEESFFDLEAGIWSLSSGGFPSIAGIERIIGTQKLDRIEGSAVNETFNGGAGDDILIGRGGGDLLFGGIGNDSLNGGADNDRLNGGFGKDSLWGGPGEDHFVFATAFGPANIDELSDFWAPDDTIHLDSSVFTGLTRGELRAAAFHIGPAAADASDRIIYDAATGGLFFDEDGQGGVAKIKFAQLNPGLALTNHDFFVF
jgi:serralysin